MAKRGKRRKNRRRGKRRAQPTAGHAREPELHPLGVYGQDWNDDYACIAGFTGWGFAYGVPWHEATYLLDDPEFGPRVREAQERERETDAWYGPGPTGASCDVDENPF